MCGRPRAVIAYGVGYKDPETVFKIDDRLCMRILRMTATFKQPHVKQDNDYLATLKDAAVTGTGQRIQAVNKTNVTISPLVQRGRLPV